MADERFDAVDVVRRLGGSASWSQITRYSTAHSLKCAVAIGALRRIGRGVYALPETPLPYPAAIAARGLVSHQSAARHWKLEALNPDTATHVTVPRHARPQPLNGVSLHFSDVAAADDHGGVTSPIRTVLDCAVSLPFAEALSIADSALRLAVVSSDELIAAALSRQGAGRQRMIRVAGEATGLAANPFESGLRATVLQAGIHGFQPQQPIQLPNRTAWVDLGDPVRRIALEADSFIFHGSPEALRHDCERYNELICLGWLPLRFAYAHVALESEWLASVVGKACTLRVVDRRRTRRNSG